jgi:hypothetical protein
MFSKYIPNSRHWTKSLSQNKQTKPEKTKTPFLVFKMCHNNVVFINYSIQGLFVSNRKIKQKWINVRQF